MDEGSGGLCDGSCWFLSCVGCDASRFLCGEQMDECGELECGGHVLYG